MSKFICVFCSSSDKVRPVYSKAAQKLGALIAKRGDTLVYGGCRVGLMGELARSTREHGGKIVGVIPKIIHDRKVVYDHCDELIITRDLRERKAIMQERADAFVGLPGGFGTLEEIFEIMTLKQLGDHNRPVIFVNTNSFYEPLTKLFTHIYQEKFAKPEYKNLYHISDSPEDAFEYLDSYQSQTITGKWF